MSIEEIVKAWKADDSLAASTVPANPIGEELSDEALLGVAGGMACDGGSSCDTCFATATCSYDYTIA
ncbi:hypothetical protein [Dictyobacter aurantiacus]|uniref:Mersacidin/lichenicidin family type 2 lantibiotic n=1 Tax=Dictyobacter aurantiacus TaxID=1936993 RepID=A0A401ZGE8_9CHLR|nr:hypothetical protein [Dictyobacter aurantiacus]GCE05964.1 hypothetical protein KDAU_32930 [Dictyobacter aurantiacus]